MRRGRWTSLHAVVLSTTLFGSVALADDVAWNGFFTTGTAFSNRSTPYAEGISKDPQIVPDTYIGLNLSKSLTPTLSAAAQFLARDWESDSAVKADWAFVTYHPVDALTFTVGKQKMPMWLVSAYIDVGTAYPWVRPPDEVYSLFNLKSFTGASLLYQLAVAGSTLSFEPYGGETEIEGAPNAPTANSKITGRNLVGGVVEWEWQRTLLRAAYNRGAWDLNLGNTADLGERHVEIWSYGLSTKQAGFTLMAEYATTKDLDQQKYLNEADQDAAAAAADQAAGNAADAATLAEQATLLRYRLGGKRAYYVTGGYQISAVSVYLTYASLKYMVLPGATEDQTSTALGVNYDLTPESVLKVEAKRVTVPGGSTGLFQVAPGGLPGDLSGAMIYSTSYNITF